MSINDLMPEPDPSELEYEDPFQESEEDLTPEELNEIAQVVRYQADEYQRLLDDAGEDTGEDVYDGVFEGDIEPLEDEAEQIEQPIEQIEGGE